MPYIRSRNSNQTNREVCSWNKATPTDKRNNTEIIRTKLAENMSNSKDLLEIIAED